MIFSDDFSACRTKSIWTILWWRYKFCVWSRNHNCLSSIYCVCVDDDELERSCGLAWQFGTPRIFMMPGPSRQKSFVWISALSCMPCRQMCSETQNSVDSDSTDNKQALHDSLGFYLDRNTWQPIKVCSFWPTIPRSFLLFLLWTHGYELLPYYLRRRLGQRH